MNQEETEPELPPISFGNVTGNVVVSQNQSGGITAHTVTITSDAHRALSDEKTNEIKDNLSNLILNYPHHPYLRIDIEAGDFSRHKVAMQLESFLSPFQLGVYSNGNTHIGIKPDYATTVELNPINQDFAIALFKALMPYIECEYRFECSESFSTEYVRLYINARPTFNHLGQVYIF